jgi:hypothetical protein
LADENKCPSSKGAMKDSSQFLGISLLKIMETRNSEMYVAPPVAVETSDA